MWQHSLAPCYLTVVMELLDSLRMNCKSEFDFTFFEMLPERKPIFFTKELIIFIQNEYKHGIFMSYKTNILLFSIYFSNNWNKLYRTLQFEVSQPIALHKEIKDMHTMQHML